jgi:hypothetical protein
MLRNIKKLFIYIIFLTLKMMKLYQILSKESTQARERKRFKRQGPKV